MASWWASTGRETWLETKKQDSEREGAAAPASRSENTVVNPLPTMQSAEVCPHGLYPHQGNEARERVQRVVEASGSAAGPY